MLVAVAGGNAAAAIIADLILGAFGVASTLHIWIGITVAKSGAKVARRTVRVLLATLDAGGFYADIAGSTVGTSIAIHSLAKALTASLIASAVRVTGAGSSAGSIDTAEVTVAVAIKDTGLMLGDTTSVDANLVGLAVISVQTLGLAGVNTGEILAALASRAVTVATTFRSLWSLTTITDAAFADGAIIGADAFQLGGGVAGAKVIGARVGKTLCRDSHFVADVDASKAGGAFVVVFANPATNLLASSGGAVVIEADAEGSVFNAILCGLADLAETSHAALIGVAGTALVIDADLARSTFYVAVALFPGRRSAVADGLAG